MKRRRGRDGWVGWKSRGIGDVEDAVAGIGGELDIRLFFLVELALPTGSPSFIATLSLFGFLAFMMQNRHRSIDQKCRLIFIILA